MRKYISISENSNEYYRSWEGGLRPKTNTNIWSMNECYRRGEGGLRPPKKDLFWKEVKVGYFGYVIVYY